MLAFVKYAKRKFIRCIPELFLSFRNLIKLSVCTNIYVNWLFRCTNIAKLLGCHCNCGSICYGSYIKDAFATTIRTITVAIRSFIDNDNIRNRARYVSGKCTKKM